ncbi:hypothetical protein AVEN_238650-1 [Araneus ventricosus]|uniref:Uncharacterized protein n=1 Tax=Araneus ventricosus TaxID=182803 RepID=A0A4Y2KTH0_ARAVE|nr:hypothetical protein AVEN_238650-1 [Araneus ventricosus]
MQEHLQNFLVQRQEPSESPENTPEKPRYPFLSYFSILFSSRPKPLSEAEAPPKEKLPNTPVINQSPRKIFKGWQTRNSLSLPFRTLGVGDAGKKAPTAFLLHPPFFNPKNALRPTKNQIPDTDPKRVKNTTIFSSKVSSRVGKRNFLKCASTESQKGSGVSRKFALR